MKTLLFLSVLIVAAGPAWEQTEHAPGPDCPMKEAVAASPYAGMEQREIKAISDDDRRRLLQGHGMGLALAAELNRFPGPKHVLELAAGLGLSDEQI
ncbi:MAG: hypothetical protein GTO30_07610, partial [Acidobacteria bacterium]|nr:hypothetical protein [Acidobacteriota bacterium]NIQ84997.1 hypothetical protein [Acidobacteriota bacterium]